ncbi:MAG: 4-(cytidine 5'-diphospho)-2-C-methyl-D-erythritol kinase [Gammaproteobacteria bacterium]|nr:MAG: 4-(cytidine 5'-diphospho)-2-C-methyl-D-erythritol kinase [Gammaproteobacteria bacterium]RLA53751.1 MAG: 4-(cytidine 5'-diphospho)-2-C-methyl-D-erythritol kinase [Gammaproteobacteria bacterium]
MLQLPAPAKLNLFLHVIGRRADGYHDIQTLFQLLDYSDELTFEARADKTITVTTYNEQFDPQTNLVTLAAQQLQRQSSCQQGANISLLKRLPLGGGLGGGSSDAATTLIGLNKLWKLGYNRDDLAKIGVKLGADVPIFVYGHTAWADGIGDVLSAVKMPDLWYLVLAPNCQVSTAAIFNDEELTRNAPPITIRAFREHGADNSCQIVVEKRYPEVKAVRLWLSKYAAAQMTGTGSCVFASFTDQAQAAAVLAEKPEQWRGFIARGVNKSPAYCQ